jgi:hypothetical protein
MSRKSVVADGDRPLGDACSLAEVLQQLLDSRRREGAIVTAWSTLEANEDAIAGDLAGSSPVDVLLEPARQARDGDEPLTGLASHSQERLRSRLIRSLVVRFTSSPTRMPVSPRISSIRGLT